MQELSSGDAYRTPEGSGTFVARALPTLALYAKVLGLVRSGARAAKRGAYSDELWARQSCLILKAMEESGADVGVEGLDNLRRLDRPAVFVGNHMSMMETVVLPCLIAAYRPVTFVVKRSLLETPWFGRILATRNPVVVGRENARQDLTAVLDEGKRRLEDGVSVVVFPQSTRSVSLERRRFNTIGCKLARRAGAPIVPTAIKSDAWGQGKLVKDFGRFDPSKTVRFSFGQPIAVHGSGRDAHEATYAFIEENLSRFLDEEAGRAGQ